MPSTINIRATPISSVRPSRGGITKAKKTKRSADDNDRQSVTHSPHGSDEESGAGRRLSSDDGADRHHMIGVRGMAHAEHEPHENQRQNCDHVRVPTPAIGLPGTRGRNGFQTPILLFDSGGYGLMLWGGTTATVFLQVVASIRYGQTCLPVGP